jgi:endonuclease III
MSTTAPLLQERAASENPFRVLVACSLLRGTEREEARRVYAAIFNRWSTPTELYKAGELLEELLQPLGMYRQRGLELRTLAREYLRQPPGRAADVAALPGCGQFACDSWTAFVEDDLTVEPVDDALNARVRDLRRDRRNQ